MPTLNIGGRKVTVSDEVLGLSPEQQSATVEEIASSFGPAPAPGRGNPLRLADDVHQVIMAPVGGHSEKPDEVYGRIRCLYPGPYLELFARKPRDDWTIWGNEVDSYDAADDVTQNRVDARAVAKPLGSSVVIARFWMARASSRASAVEPRGRGQKE
jgi:hypothetical protein